MVAVFCSALYGQRKTTVFLFHVLQTMVNRHIPCMLAPDTVWLSRPCCSFFSYRIAVDKKRDFYFPIVSVDHCCRVVLTCHFLMPGYKPQRATSGFAIVRGDEQMLYFQYFCFIFSAKLVWRFAMAAPSQSRRTLHAIALTASAQDIFTYCPPLSVFQWTRNMNKMAVF